MTKKQLRYIMDICPQTIECGKHIIKPGVMSKKMLSLSNPITQNFIAYGKAWRDWCKADDEIIKLELYKSEDDAEYDYHEEVKRIAFKEMNKLTKLLEQQLNELGWAEYEANLDSKEVLL